MNKNKLEKRHRQTSISSVWVSFRYSNEIKIKKKKKNERNAVLPPCVSSTLLDDFFLRMCEKKFYITK